MDFFEMGGRGRLRVRESYVRDAVAPLLNSRAVGALKVDLALRSVAVSDGERWLVDSDVTYDAIHDLCRPVEFYGAATKLKRQWVSEQLGRLQKIGLLQREARPGGRPRLVVLRDDRSGLPMDDPGVASDPYVSFFGDAFRFGHMARWGAPPIAAYFAAMVAERFARADSRLDWLQEGRELGQGVWYRSLDWFEDPDGRRPDHHVRIPFSTRTLRRGITELRSELLIASIRAREDPATGRRFKAPQGRYIYFNGFDDFRGRRRSFKPDWAALLNRGKGSNVSTGQPSKPTNTH